MKKEKAASALVRLGLAKDEKEAARLIMGGHVAVDLGGNTFAPVTKAGEPVRAQARLVVRGINPFVSRGAYKLLGALTHFQLDVTGAVCLDAGASTGGFTDCLLQRGAARVYAVDVGRCQLHERLRQDARVISLEGVNLRHAPPDLLPEGVDMAVADVSFTSLVPLLPAINQFLKPGGTLVALVKPQFELGSARTQKGVVRDPALRQEAVRRVESFAQNGLGLAHLGTVPASVQGAKGNQEYLAAFAKPGTPEN